MRNQTTYDPGAKRHALERAAEVGPEAAARELGIPAGTLRRWRTEVGESGPPPGADVQAWGERKRRGAESSWEVAIAATRKALEAIEEGDTLAAQRAMITAGIAADKTGTMLIGADEAEARLARISEAQTTVLANLIGFYLRDCLGLPFDGMPRKVLASLLRQAGAGEPLTLPAEADAAREEIRRALGVEASRPALPAPAVVESAAEPVEVAEVVDADPIDEAAGLIVAYLEEHPGEALEALCREIDEEGWRELEARVRELLAARGIEVS